MTHIVPTKGQETVFVTKKSNGDINKSVYVFEARSNVLPGKILNTKNSSTKQIFGPNQFLLASLKHLVNHEMKSNV